MSLLERAIEFLLQLHPVPLTRCNWARGWAERPMKIYEVIANQRFRACTILHQMPVMDIATLDSDIKNLNKYADNLLLLIHSDRLPSRTQIMCFDWAFPAESRKPPKEIEDPENMMDMRSSYIAYEYMCIAISSAILSFKVAKLTHDQYPTDEPRVKQRYMQTVDYLQKLQDILANIFSLEQLTSLRSQSVPMQMQHRWLGFFRAHVQYKLVCFAQPDNLYIVKVAAQQYSRTALEWLRDPILTETQTAIAQCAYDCTLLSYTRQNIRWHCKESELAEYEIGPPVAYTIIKRAFVMINRLTERQKEEMKEVIQQCTQRINGLRQMCVAPAPEEDMNDWWILKGYDLFYCQ